MQYHISKVAQSEPQIMSNNPAMDDLDSALQSLEVKMEGEGSSASDLLVRYNSLTRVFLKLNYFNNGEPKFITI